MSARVASSARRWTSAEDSVLREIVATHSGSSGQVWMSTAQMLNKRCRSARSAKACNEHWMVLSGTHPCLHTRNRCQRDSGKKKLPRGGRVSKQQCAPPSRQKAAPAASRAVVSSQLVKKHFCPSFVRMPARADEVAYLFDVADSSGKSRATWYLGEVVSNAKWAGWFNVRFKGDSEAERKPLACKFSASGYGTAWRLAKKNVDTAPASSRDDSVPAAVEILGSAQDAKRGPMLAVQGVQNRMRQRAQQQKERTPTTPPQSIFVVQPAKHGVGGRCALCPEGRTRVASARAGKLSPGLLALVQKGALSLQQARDISRQHAAGRTSAAERRSREPRSEETTRAQDATEPKPADARKCSGAAGDERRAHKAGAVDSEAPRAGDSVSAQYDGERFAATIVAVHDSGAEYTLLWEDGMQSRSTRKRLCMRPLAAAGPPRGPSQLLPPDCLNH